MVEWFFSRSEHFSVELAAWVADHLQEQSAASKGTVVGFVSAGVAGGGTRSVESS